MGLFLKKRVEMPDKMILGNTEFVFDRRLGFHVGELIVWDRKGIGKNADSCRQLIYW